MEKIEQRGQPRVDYLVNRASAIFKAAFPEAVAVLKAPLEQTLFTYWDTYGGKPLILPEGSDGARVFQLVDRQVTNPLAHKRLLARSLRSAQLCEWAPECYESAAAALQQDSAERAIWFIKPVLGSGGRGMFCVHGTELATLTLEPDQILQRGVDNLRLIDGHKFTVRVYVLIWNGAVYLYNDGFAVIHGVPYEPGSTDYAVQIDHRGYEKDGSAVRLMAMRDDSRWAADRLQIAACLADLRPILEPVIDASSDTNYAVLGLDFLFTDEPGIQLLEINNMPNFIHSREINQAVNIPFWHGVMACLLSEGTARVASLWPL